MELWDIYDRDRCALGKTHVRGEQMPAGAYHIIVHCCIFNSQGQMLIQHRQPFKKGWPNMWDITVGGSALSGESSQQAIQRELFEEVSISCNFDNVRPRLSVNFDVGFDDIYLVEQDVDIDTLHLQYEEVQAVQWATCDEILRRIDNGTFIPYHKGFISMLFDMRSSNGAGNF